MYERRKDAVLLLLCSLFQGAWVKLLQLHIDALPSFLVINGNPRFL